jgi:hypothetical protein
MLGNMRYVCATLLMNVHELKVRKFVALETPLIVIAPHVSPIFVSNTQLFKSTALDSTFAEFKYIVIAAPHEFIPLAYTELYLK